MFSRVVPKARRHVMMTEGREGLWQYVKSRKTFELPSGRVLSFDTDVRNMSYEELTRPLPGHIPMDIYVEFIMDRLPSMEEFDRHVPAMPVKTATHNPKKDGTPTNGWEHRSRRSGWVTHAPSAVARKVTAKELERNPGARDKMYEEHSKLTNGGGVGYVRRAQLDGSRSRR